MRQILATVFLTAAALAAQSAEVQWLTNPH
jgi:hypothetical protein